MDPAFDDIASGGDVGPAGMRPADGGCHTPDVLNSLLPQIYSDLQQVARRHLRGERSPYALECGALVNEAYLRLRRQSGVRFENHDHLLAISSGLMHEILVDDARRRRAQKRGGRYVAVSVDDVVDERALPAMETLALTEALDALERHAPRQRRVVELRYLVGLSIGEVAAILRVSPGTVRHDWGLARTFLYAWLATTLKPTPGQYLVPRAWAVRRPARGPTPLATMPAAGSRRRPRSGCPDRHVTCRALHVWDVHPRPRSSPAAA
jgi:RNA polymerase sigma factor (TIGR02999 family)